MLGPERGARCLELARHARLSRRWLATDAVAQLVVGTETLGLEWWSRPHFVMADFDDWEDRGAPDGLLAAGQDPGGDDRWCGSCLGTLGSWISEDAADAQWGRPVDWVDLNRPDVNDRVHLPAAVSSGDRLVVAYDPGGRVWAEVVDWGDAPDEYDARAGYRQGRLGTRLDLDSCRHCDTAHVGWAWGMATDTAPMRLPGEVPGGSSDPFTRKPDPVVVGRLYTWALDHGANASVLGPRWATIGELFEAMYRLGHPWIPDLGRWWHWERAARALVDGDDIALAAELENLPE